MSTRPDPRSSARRVIALMDLTNLEYGCVPGEIDALCAAASTAAGPVAAVCVWPAFVGQAAGALRGTGIKVATVVNFPAGGEVVAATVAETLDAVADGADEVDVVVPYRALLRGDTAAVPDMVGAVVAAAGGTHVKAILETGELTDPALIAAAARDAIQAGAHFVKTSSGKTRVSATPEAAETMLGVIHDLGGADGVFHGRTLGIKPSGGIRTVEQAAVYLDLADRIMGPAWATPSTFRFGASGLLDDALAHLA